jgi:serine/threonine-protein kinase
MTQAGMILGTASYMSPEQARGKAVDRRADIWAFGVVLYEMLTGRRPFEGEDVAEVMASVIHKDPDLTGLPPAVGSVVERCLRKDPRRRMRDIGDVRMALEEAPAQTQAAAPHSKPAWIPWTVAGALILAVLSLTAALYRATRPAPLRPLIRVNVDLPEDTPLARSANGGMLTLSPDGTRLALVLRGPDGKSLIHTRRLDQGQFNPLSGTENAAFPFFSPDGLWLGFFADGKMKKISVEGGPAVALCDAPNGRGASWGDDGNIIAALAVTGVLSRIPAAGGTPVPVTKTGREITDRWPQILPGNRAVLYTANVVAANYDEADIVAVSLDTGEQKIILHGGFFARYLPVSEDTGYLIYLHESTLLAAPFSVKKLALTGPKTPILEDVSSNTVSGGDFAISVARPESSPFIYLSGKGQSGAARITWVASDGKAQLLHAPVGIYFTPRFSPDGKRIAFSMVGSQGEDIWMKDLERDTPSRLTFLPGLNRWPVWTPDGKNIIFHSSAPSAPGLYWIRSDGSGEAQRLTDGKLDEAPYSISADGKLLAFSQKGAGGRLDIFTARIEAEARTAKLGKVELFLGTPADEVTPAFSPDGGWMAYVSDESGISEVYVRAFPGPGGRWQISTGGGLYPVWSRSGHELLFETLERRVLAVSYTAQVDSFNASKPRLWSDLRLVNTVILSNYDLAPDGKRIAAILEEVRDQKSLTRLTFLGNLLDELRRRVP